MKYLISIISVFTFLLAFTGNAEAQSDITASTDIVEALTFTNPAQLKFGQILTSQTTDAIVDPNGTDSNVGGTAQEGKITVTGSDTASVTIDFTNPTNLSDGGTQTIGFTPNYAGNTSDNKSGATDLNTGSTNTVTLSSSSGNYYIYYGGTLTGSDIGNATVAYFSGTIQTSISYE